MRTQKSLSLPGTYIPGTDIKIIDMSKMPLHFQMLCQHFGAWASKDVQEMERLEWSLSTIVMNGLRKGKTKYAPTREEALKLVQQFVHERYNGGTAKAKFFWHRMTCRYISMIRSFNGPRARKEAAKFHALLTGSFDAPMPVDWRKDPVKATVWGIFRNARKRPARGKRKSSAA
jgi:hypothetical protein